MLEAKYQQNDCISCLPHSKAIYQNIFEDKDGGEDERGNRFSESKAAQNELEEQSDQVEGAQVALHQDQGGGQPGQVGGADRTRAAVQQRQYSVEHSRLYGITGLNRLRRPLPSRYKLTYQSVLTRLYKRRRTGQKYIQVRVL